MASDEDLAARVPSAAGSSRRLHALVAITFLTTMAAGVALLFWA